MSLRKSEIQLAAARRSLSILNTVLNTFHKNPNVY